MQLYWNRAGDRRSETSFFTLDSIFRYSSEMLYEIMLYLEETPSRLPKGMTFRKLVPS